MRVLRFLLLGILAGLLVVTPAQAANVDEVAAELNFRGYSIEPGARGDVNAMEQLVADTRDDGRWYFVSLAEDPEGGNDLFARRVSEFIGESGTILVDSPGEVGADSADYGDPEIGDAIDSALPALRDDFPGGSRAFYEALSAGGLPPAGADDRGIGAPESSATRDTRSNRGIFGLLLPLGAVLGISLIWRALSRRKKNNHLREQDTRIARRELQDQLDALASSIVDRSDMIGIEGNAAATAHYREANIAYTEALEGLESAETLQDLAVISIRVDRARWQIEAAEALVEGREVPPEPVADEPASCFFDPTHPAGVEDAEIQTAAGSRTVKVCRADAEKLRRGERPTSRTITVGDRRVPAGMAPRSHGGQGMGGLGAFSVLLQGLAQGMAFDWSSRQPSARDRPRRPGGTFGTDFTTRRGTRNRVARPRRSGSTGRRPSIGRARRKK
jgi:hypothetical protein